MGFHSPVSWTVRATGASPPPAQATASTSHRPHQPSTPPAQARRSEPVNDDRDLDWDGCYNVRDLGGLHPVDGRVTRFGALVRSDAPSALTAPGWAAVRTHGIATVIDLVEDHE